jgi:hypothetical protein
MPVSVAAIRTAKRVDRFSYAIRNIVVEAEKVEATGKHAAPPQHRRSQSVWISRRRTWSTPRQGDA